MSDSFNLLGLPAPGAIVGRDSTISLPTQPDLNEVFAQPNLEEVFAPPKPLYSRIPLVDHFIRGFKHGFGEGISEDSKKWLRDVGILGPQEVRQRSIMQDFTERYLLGAAEAGYFGFRALSGAVYGTSEAMVGAGVPKDATPAALWEAFPAGRLTGAPYNVPIGRTSPTMRRLLPRDTPPRPLDLDAAAELGVFGRSPEVIARESLSPDRGVTRLEVEPLARAEPVAPPDLHTVARQYDPETFAKYDELAAQKEQLRTWIDEVAAQRVQEPTAVALQREIDTILGRVRGAEERLTGRAARRLEETRDALDNYLKEENASMAMLRRDLIKADEGMRDLAPQVSEAYREARRLVPEEVASAEVIELRPKDINTELKARGWMDEAVKEMSAPEKRLALEQSQPVPVQEIKSLAQRALSIARDTERRLIAAGRPAEEARASAALVQAHYEARAARFGGALGTARDLYEAEAPRVQGVSGTARGRLILREQRNTIQLMERADASTFVHETAHNWLEELRRDAVHKAAPPDLLADIATVKEWLGTEGDTFTRAQHERFARGFERYLMEGQAPSTQLARVFEKFKEWLTAIYQSVARLRAPINDDIRGVYDRLISTPSREPVIVAERPGSRTWAEDAMASVRETPAADAAAKADQIAAQRERVAAQLKEAMNAGRREARRGPERVKVADVGDGERKPDFVREAFNATADDLDAGRNTTTAKGEAPRSATDRFEPGDRPLVDKAGNIRIDNLMVGDDVAEAIRQAAGEKTGFIEARRGVLSDAETIKLAEEIGVDPNKIDRWAVAEAWTAEQIVFARGLLRDSATRVRDAALRLATTVDEQGLIDYAMARERHMMIQERVSAVTAEAGRAMRAFRALEGEKDAKIISSLLQQNTGRTPAQLRREARLVSTLDTSAKVNKQMSRMRDPTWGDMFVEGWINALVSGPMTHAVNTMTNAGVMMGAPIETVASGIIGKAFELAGRERGVTLGEAIDRVHGMGQGSVDGLRAFGAIILDESKIPSQRGIDVRPMQAIPSVTVNIAGTPIRLGGATVRLPGRFLAAEDEFFKAVAWQQEINVLSRRAAIAEGLEGDALAARIDRLRENPTDSIRAAAERFAEYQTFQTPLGRFGQSILNFANTHPLVRLILPFVRTPINLLKYSVERSPLGFASAEVWSNMTGRNGAVARDTQIGRMAVGNMVALGVGYLAYNGLVSGGGPTRAEEQMTLRMTGWQPYSFRVGDLWISYRRFDPFSNTIGLAADMAALAKYGVAGQDEFGGDATIEKFQAMAMTSIWRNIFDKMSMRGVTSVAQALIDWEHYGRGFTNGLVGSFVPGILGQTARMEDELDREARTAFTSLQSRIPFMREDLLPKRDRWGEPVIAREWGPAQVRAVNDDPVNQAMLNLGINVAQPQRKIGGIELTEQQYDDYVRLSGRMAKNFLDGLVTAEFRTMPPGVQVDVIKSMIESSRAMARAALNMQALGTDNDLVQKGVDLRLKMLETGHR